MFDHFRRLVRDSVIDCYTFVITHDEKVIEVAASKGRWSDSPDSTARVLDELVGFEFLNDAKFDYGIAHPEQVSTRRLSAEARANFGPSMVDAFSPFDRALRHAFPDIVYTRVFRKHERQCNIITFGSPSSNSIARAVLGYRAESKFKLSPQFEADRYPVRYELGDETLTVKRRGGDYLEPRWAISTPEGRLETRLTNDGHLAEDYLVISCVPNLLSDQVGDVLDARRELEELRQDPALDSRIAASSEERRKLSALEEQAGRDDRDLHRVVVIGGLHGPGTGAASLLLGEPRLAKRLEARVRQEQLDRGFWQAVVKVTDVRVDPTTGRDVPAGLADRIDVYAVNIA